ERSHEAGFVVASAHALIDASVIRDTLPRASDKGLGRGVVATPQGAPSDAGAILEIRSSVVAQSRSTGVWIGGSSATIESSVIDDTLPDERDQRHAARGGA